MCQFGDESKIIDERIVDISESLIGYRLFRLPIKGDLILKSLNQEFIWDKNKASVGLPERDNSEGIYSYNNYYNYYNYYNCYDYYDYYDYYNYYNYYNYYYSYYNYYNCYDYYDYYIAAKIHIYGNIFFYGEGSRTSFAVPIELAILSNKRWFDDNRAKKFAGHFNSRVELVAEEYNCKIITYKEFSNELYE